MLRGLLIGLAALLVGCGPTVVEVAGAPVRDFDFVRDDAGLLDDEAEAWAQARLSELAGFTGVYGVVLSPADVQDPTTAIGRALEELNARGAAGVVGLCTPDDCSLTSAAGVTADLRDGAARTAPAPAPAAGQGIVTDEVGLSAWVEFVGAVAASGALP